MATTPTASGSSQPSWDFRKPYHVLRFIFGTCEWPLAVKTCYLALYHHRNGRTGKAKVEFRTLAAELSVTPKVAVAQVKSLEQAGAIKVERGQRTGRHKDANEYTIIPPWEASRTAERIASWKRKPEAAQAGSLLPRGTQDDPLLLPQGTQDLLPQGTQEGKQPEGERSLPPAGTQITLPLEGACVPSGHVSSNGLKNTSSLSSSGPSGAEAVRKRSSSRSGGEQESNPHGSVAGTIVRQYDVWVKAQTGVGVSSKQWPAVVNMVKNALAGGKAGAPIPHEEAEASFTAALTDDYWRGELLTYGLTTTMLRRIWARSKGGAPAAGGRRGAYVDRHANGPQPGDFSGMRVKEA